MLHLKHTVDSCLQSWSCHPLLHAPLVQPFNSWYFFGQQQTLVFPWQTLCGPLSSQVPQRVSFIEKNNSQVCLPFLKHRFFFGCDLPKCSSLKTWNKSLIKVLYTCVNFHHTQTTQCHIKWWKSEMFSFKFELGKHHCVAIQLTLHCFRNISSIHKLLCLTKQKANLCGWVLSLFTTQEKRPPCLLFNCFSEKDRH